MAFLGFAYLFLYLKLCLSFVKLFMTSVSSYGLG